MSSRLEPFNVVHALACWTTVIDVVIFSKENKDMTGNVKLKSVVVTIFAVKKQYLLHILSVRMYSYLPSMNRVRAVFSSVVCPSVSYFSTSSHKQHDFGGKGGGKILNIKCVF